MGLMMVGSSNESFKRGHREAVEEERKAILAKQPGTQLLIII